MYRNKVIYQIWPRSFKDSNNDGIGDIQGIISKLDYLKDLGIDLVWISPLYKSSNFDYGYDIDNYYEINPEFGTMDDFDVLLKEAKKRNIGIIMDLVANHTSDKHEWFQNAINNPNSKYRDYYFFKKEPNNWLSFFGGSSWTLDPKSKEYYLTQFTPNQCDLNWENPEVRKGVYDIMKFWLNKGVTGFRMDVISAISKKEGLPSKNPELKGLQFPGDYTINRDKCHDYIKEMNREVISKFKCFSLGEGVLLDTCEAVKYTKPENNELDMMFQFDLALLGCGPLGKFDPRKLYHFTILDFKKVIANWQTEMFNHNGWICNYLSNHDQPRQISRLVMKSYIIRKVLKH